MKKYIPTILTLIRICTTTYLCFVTGTIGAGLSKECFTAITVLTVIIFISDFLDGKLARKWDTCSKEGAVLDIAADLYYMLSQVLILSYFEYLPRCIFYCMVIEFVIFTFSSRMLNSQNSSRPVFDLVGRVTASIYYATPYFMVFMVFINYIKVGSFFITILCLMFTIMAICGRMMLIIKRYTL